jgi:hypothetical protein
MKVQKNQAGAKMLGFEPEDEGPENCRAGKDRDTPAEAMENE